MDNKLSYKEKLIKNMDVRPYGCRIECLPPGTVCLFKDITLGLLRTHENHHSESILGKYEDGILQKPKRTKARYFEVNNSELERLKEKLKINPIVPHRSAKQSVSVNKVLNAKSVSISTVTKSLISRSIEKNDTGANDTSPWAPKSKQAAVFNDAFKQKVSKWECRDCITKNDQV